MAPEIESQTVNGRRTFSGNVVVDWTQSETAGPVTVVIEIGGATAWEYTFDPDNAEAAVKGSGDTWALEGGTFTVNFSGDAGQLKAHDWKYSVEEDKHHFEGLIGNW